MVFLCLMISGEHTGARHDFYHTYSSTRLTEKVGHVPYSTNIFKLFERSIIFSSKWAINQTFKPRNQKVWTRFLLKYLKTDRNFCSVHEEITSISVSHITMYVEWAEQIISINPYKWIQTFFCYHMILKYIYLKKKKANNWK